MKDQHRIGWAALIALACVGPAAAQETGGFKGWLKRTGQAVVGVPATNGSPTVASNPATSANGATTTGPVFRPISPARGGEFQGIFDGYSIAKNSPRGHYPRVALTAEVYGGSQPCWTFRATIWQSAAAHHDERFELCNAPLMTKDDLGQPVEAANPTGPLMSVITGHQTMPSTHVQVSTQRTTGPDPAAMPFAVQIAATTPAGKAMLAQYDQLLARAMFVSGYAPPDQMISGTAYRTAGTVGSDGRLMWFAGFEPGGNRDTAPGSTN